MNLTPRELEIVQLIAQGKQNKHIGEHLGISRFTVSTHLRRAFNKLGVKSRAAAVAKVWSLANALEFNSLQYEQTK